MGSHVCSDELATCFETGRSIHFHACEPILMLVAATTPSTLYYTHRAGAFRYPPRRLLRYKMGGTIVRTRFAGVAANTNHAADFVSTLFHVDRTAIEVVYNGIHWDSLRPERAREAIRSELGLSQGRVVVGATGILRDWKRMDILLRALDRAKQNVECIIVGDGPDRPALEALTDRLHLRDRVSFLGRKANVADYLQVCDIFVMPSGPEESFGNSAVEAMGLGIPTIICRDGGGVREHVTHTETGIIVDDITEMADWIDRLAVDPTLRSQIGEAARELTRSRYTTDEMIKGYARLYARRRR